MYTETLWVAEGAMIQIKKVVELDFFCIGQQLLLGHWVANADI